MNIEYHLHINQRRKHLFTFFLLQGIRTTAKKDGTDWIINGSKIYITNGWLTDCCILVAKTAEGKRAAHGISLFLVDADTPGFHKGRKLKKLGLKAQDTAELFLEDVRVPGSALLGRENGGFYQLMEQLPQERLIIAVHSAAHCENMFEQTRAWVRQRKAFGKSVSDLQVVQHKLAEIKTSIAVCRSVDITALLAGVTFMILNPFGTDSIMLSCKCIFTNENDTWYYNHAVHLLGLFSKYQP